MAVESAADDAAHGEAQREAERQVHAALNQMREAQAASDRTALRLRDSDAALAALHAKYERDVSSAAATISICRVRRHSIRPKRNCTPWPVHPPALDARPSAQSQHAELHERVDSLEAELQTEAGARTAAEVDLAGAKSELSRLQQSVTAMMERYERESTAALEV